MSVVHFLLVYRETASTWAPQIMLLGLSKFFCGQPSRASRTSATAAVRPVLKCIWKMKFHMRSKQHTCSVKSRN